MASARGRTIDLTGKVDLLTAYACLKRASLFIGNDSGLMHIAAAAGTPTIGLFGPSDERRYAPWGEHAMAVRGPRSFDQFLAIDPELSQAIRHMSDLPVATVFKAAKDLLAKVGGDVPPAPVATQEAEAVAPAPEPGLDADTAADVVENAPDDSPEDLVQPVTTKRRAARPSKA